MSANYVNILAHAWYLQRSNWIVGSITRSTSSSHIVTRHAAGSTWSAGLAMMSQRIYLFLSLNCQSLRPSCLLTTKPRLVFELFYFCSGVAVMCIKSPSVALGKRRQCGAQRADMHGRKHLQMLNAQRNPGGESASQRSSTYR